jgi:hypothetical protein
MNKNIIPLYDCGRDKGRAKQRAYRMLDRLEKCRNDYPHAEFAVDNVLYTSKGKLISEYRVMFCLLAGQHWHTIAVWRATKPKGKRP